MKQSTRDRAAGTLQEVQGRLKEQAGKIVGDPDLAAEGQAEQVEGSVRKTIGKIEKVFEK